ncbi:MAG: class I SAM-dependent methyltransferase [Acidobacteriia bacterium]|nr:class I SAM-dependent methyltransferase [Terriglobia bacterium]
MRSDWNDRASEDAYYYAAFGRRKQEDRQFFQTAAAVVAWLEDEMRRLDGSAEAGRALEIGCGPGRLMRPLSAHFAEIHGVDVSDRMIQLAERNLAGIPHAHVYVTSGADLAPFADEYFDFVYSYAVFQHIPSRDVVIQYLREASRVLKTNGILACQINGMLQPGAQGSTWDGVRIPADTLVALARELDCQLLALDGLGSQYMLTTWRKRAPGWRDASANRAGSFSIRVVSSAPIGKARIPAGRAAELNLALEGMSFDCDLAELSALVQGRPASVRVIRHPSPDGVSHVTIVTPPLSEASEARIELFWRGQPLRSSAAVEVTPPAKRDAVLVSATDGVNYLSGRRIISRFVKIILDDVTEPDRLRASIDGTPVRCSTPVCIDPQKARHEWNVFLPGTAGPGRHRVDVLHGSTSMPTIRIDVGLLQSADVFRGVAAGHRLLELGSRGLSTVVTILDSAEGSCGDPIAVDPARLPFPRGQFVGIVWQWIPGQAGWGELAGELRRVLDHDGALYVEIPAIAEFDRERFVKDTEARLGLVYRWRRDLARRMAPKTPPEETHALSVAGHVRALCSLGLRAADRMFGTRLARAGMGFYFGREWNQPDLRARLNGCVRCGTVHSKDQLVAAGPLTSRCGLLLYLCPSCGSPNVLTLDQ